jgi:RimJ/RimL family protein N-acetyltransferase
VTALTSPENARSLVALRRLGFVEEGILRSWHVHRGSPRDVAVLSMLREEYDRTPLANVPVSFAGNPPEAFLTAAPS